MCRGFNLMKDKDDNMSIVTMLEPTSKGHQHSILIGKKCAYCMDCGQILLEYKNKNHFKRWLKSFEELADHG